MSSGSRIPVFLCALVPLTFLAGLPSRPAGAMESIDGGLDRPFESPWETRDFKTGAEKTAHSCRELLALAPGFAPDNDIDYRAFLHTRVRCRATAALAAGRAAAVDHLGSFTINDARLAELPAALMPVLGPSKQIARLASLSVAGKTWREVERGLRITDRQGSITFVEGKESRASLEMLGRGDLNGDGIQDLLLLRAGGSKGGSASVTDVFVLTRKSPDGRLEVIRRIGER